MCAQWTTALRLRERSSTVRRRGSDRRGRPGAGSFGPGSCKTSIRGAKSGRRRSTFGGPRCGVRGVEGGSSSDLASHHFCPRIGGVASMCSTVTTGEFRSSMRAAVRRERRRRKRSQTGQESVTFDPRFGPVEPTRSGLSEPAHFEHGTCRCFSQDRDVDRDCRCQFAFEPFNPLAC